MASCPFRSRPARLRALAIAWALLVPTAVGARALTVDTAVDDDSLTACDDATPNDCSLRGAITVANANPGADTVVLPSGTYTLTIAGTGEDANATGDLDVTDDLTLEGGGAATTIIQACAVVAPVTTCQGVDRVLDVDPGAKGINVTVSGVTIRNGFAAENNGDDGGGGVRNRGTLTITDSVVTANAVDPDRSNSGGGICHRAGTLMLMRSHVDGNSSPTVAGGIFVGSGTGLGSPPAALVVTDSTVNGNQAGAAGGGIYTGASNVLGKPLITVARSTIAGNVAETQDGGGIRMGRGTLTIGDSTISGNRAANLGGGVLFVDAGLGHLFTNVTISGNQAGRGGGLEFFVIGNATPLPFLDNCTIADNVAHGVPGFAPPFGAGIEANLSIANSIIAGNLSDVNQGADCTGTITSGGYNLIQDTRNCTITGNTTGDITGADPKLGPLGDNDGPTETQALLGGSPAIDTGSPASPGSGDGACQATDQRGVARPAGPRCDIGAFEGASPGTTSTTSTTLATTTSTSTTHPRVTTTSVATTTTTTTTAATGCDGEPSAPTFASIDCRLVALLARLNAEPDLGAFRGKLVQNVSKAKDAEEAGDSACTASNLKRTRQRLKQAIRDLIQYAHHLQTLRARKKLPAALRTDLLAEGNPITDDAKRLKRAVQCPALAPLMGASLLGSATAGTGRGSLDMHPHFDGPTVLVTDLAANAPILTDRNGIVHAPHVVDPNLVNPWGLAENGASPFWVSDNNQGVVTLHGTTIGSTPLVVGIPTPGNPLSATGAPTGAVFNVDLVSKGFSISGVDVNGNTATAPAVFLFATEDGTIVGWNPGINPPGFDAAKAGAYGIIAVDNSANPTPAAGAVYTGLAIATDTTGNTFLYATNFRAGTVEIYDTSFNRVTPSAHAFTDPHLRFKYAPFNISLQSGRFFVTYARQDAARHDSVPGHGRGFVDTFDLEGNMLARFAERGHLDSPWGVVQAPTSFGQFAGDILIGNFGNGRINAFDSNTGEFLGKVINSKGQGILIDGLWSLQVGNGRAGGDPDTVYFTAGPNRENDGLFGSLTPVAPGTPCGTPCI